MGGGVAGQDGGDFADAGPCADQGAWTLFKDSLSTLNTGRLGMLMQMVALDLTIEKQQQVQGGVAATNDGGGGKRASSLAIGEGAGASLKGDDEDDDDDEDEDEDDDGLAFFYQTPQARNLRFFIFASTFRAMVREKMLRR